MSWQDRDYHRGDGGGSDGRGGRSDLIADLLAWLNKTFSIGTYFDVRVRVHITFLLLVLFELLRYQDFGWTVRWTALLFFSVLLHEYGHALACRRVGGFAHDILMWPLGGLAYCAPPRTIWAEFITVVCGPLVNLVIAISCFVMLHVGFQITDAVTLNPLQMWGPRYGGMSGLLQDIFVVNSYLLLFNLCMVFYPFDGGRLVQILLWKFVGYGRSMRLATTIGMVGAVGVGLFGLSKDRTMLVAIAIFGFVNCYQQNKFMAHNQISEPHYGPTHRAPARRDGPGLLVRGRQRLAARRRGRELDKAARFEKAINEILDKVRKQGMHSLSAGEKRMLEKATDRQRDAS